MLSLRLKHLPQPLWERDDPPGHFREPKSNAPLWLGWDRRWLKAQHRQRWPHLNCEASEGTDGFGQCRSVLGRSEGGRRLVLESPLQLRRGERDASILLSHGCRVMTHKYRGSQQSSREVKPKFIDSTQGEPKNIYKP
jgi:hypothetical protein